MPSLQQSVGEGVVADGISGGDLEGQACVTVCWQTTNHGVHTVQQPHKEQDEVVAQWCSGRG